MFYVSINYPVHSELTIDADFHLVEGEVTALVGKSGSGKSTLLNLMMGIIKGRQVTIKSDEKIYQKKDELFTPIHERQFGYIQQKPNLFPHLSLLQNLTYSQKDVNQEQLNEYVEIFELQSKLNRRVSELSGGEAQRVAIIRTLLSQPKLLLIDEGFSALDPNLREKLRDYLTLLKKRLNIPILFVTHDLKEAYQVSDQVIFIENGQQIEQGRTKTFFHTPTRLQSAKFIGVENILQGMVKNNTLIIDSAQFPCPFAKNEEVIVGVKAWDIYVDEEGIISTVRDITHDLTEMRLKINVEGILTPLVMNISRGEAKKMNIKLNETLKISIAQFIFLEE